MDLKFADDDTLAVLAQEGNFDAEEELLSRYLKLTLEMARKKYTPHGDFDAEDLAQSGAIALIRAIHTYRPDSPASFKTYASRCIHNKIADVLKKKAPETVVIDEPDDEGADDPETALIEMEAAQQLIDKISGALTPFERNVLKLLLDSLTYKQIADKLGVEKKKVDNTIFFLRNKIRGMLGE